MKGKSDGFFIALTSPTDSDGFGRPDSDGSKPGIYRIAFMVRDIAVCYELLRSQLPDLAPPSLGFIGDDLPTLSALFFDDPDGAIVELLAVVDGKLKDRPRLPSTRGA